MKEEFVMSSAKKYVAEFIGTCVLVVFGCGTAMTVGCASDAGCGYILTALAFGLVIVAMAYSIGNVSGCHINPAVSIAMLVAKKMTAADFIGYVIAQFLGGIAGAGILKAVFTMGGLTDKTAGLGANALCGGSVGATVLVEIILTFVFVLAIMGVTSKKEFNGVCGLVIGLTLTLVHIFGIGLTGTSVNPARSFGPALFAGGDAVKCVWVFIVAPLIGGVLAAIVYNLLDAAKKPAPSAPAPKKKKKK